jgi:hypothetical protein
MKKISLDRIHHFVMKKQHLTPDSKINDIVQIVKDMGGLHATSATTPYLSLFARTEKFEKMDLSKELSHRKSLARVRYVRNTVHILPRDFIAQAFAATQRMTGMVSERHYRYFGFSPRDYDRISGKILDILKGRGLTTKEIKEKLRTSRNIAPFVNLMCDRGLLIRGFSKEGWKSNIHTYFRVLDYYPDLDLTEFDEEEARESVIQQYISSFGPVAEKDIVWWTGFPVKQVRNVLRKLEREILTVEISGLDGRFFLLCSEWDLLRSSEPPRTRVVNLLPYLDPYLMGYKCRERYLDSPYNEMILDRSGNATATILVDGQIIGVWDFDEPWIKLCLFQEVKRKTLDLIYSEAAEIGAFIADRAVQIKRCDLMVPLPHRAAGAFMFPLRDC